jgi:integrase
VLADANAALAPDDQRAASQLILGPVLAASALVGLDQALLVLGRDNRPRRTSSDQQRPPAAACRAARIEPPVIFHGLRHTWASQRIMQGMPVMVAAQVLGHSEPRIVERHYGHLCPGFVRQTIEATGMDLGEENSGVTPLRRIA